MAEKRSFGALSVRTVYGRELSTRGRSLRPRLPDPVDQHGAKAQPQRFSFPNWYLRIARIPVLLAVGLSFGAYRERARMSVDGRNLRRCLDLRRFFVRLWRREPPASPQVPLI